MSETKWTPGPWEIQEEDSFADMPFIRIGVGDRAICEALPPVDADEIDEETRANAYLSTAAPDLYAATDLIVGKIIESFSKRSADKLPIELSDDDVRALINARRKARGE